MLRFLMNAFSPLQVWRNARFLYDLDKPFLLTVYLAGLPLRFIALESFAVFVIEPLQRLYFSTTACICRVSTRGCLNCFGGIVFKALVVRGGFYCADGSSVSSVYHRGNDGFTDGYADETVVWVYESCLWLSECADICTILVY